MRAAANCLRTRETDEGRPGLGAVDRALHRDQELMAAQARVQDMQNDIRISIFSSTCPRGLHDLGLSLSGVQRWPGDACDLEAFRDLDLE